MKPSYLRTTCAVVLLLHTLLLVYSAYVHSPNANEPPHLVAGLTHLERGTFELYRVNPPLVRAVAALPAYLTGITPDWRSWRVRPDIRPVFEMGMDFFDDQGLAAFQLVFFGRLCCIPFSWLGALVCCRWAAALYGDRAGVVALTLWCFSPAILTHAAFLTPDAGATACGVASCYLFWKWLRNPGWAPALAAGGVLGVALLTKSTWIVLFGLWPLIWIFCQVRSNPRLRFGETRLLLAQLILILVTGLHVLNMGYLYSGAFTKLSDFRFISEPLTGEKLSELPQGWGNRFQSGLLGQVPVPLPFDYVMGIDIQKRDFEMGRRTCFRQRWFDHGFWYYYLYGLAVKVPIGAFLLAILSFVARVRTGAKRQEFALIVPPLGVFLLVSLSDEWNAHLRYILPCFPFAFIWISQSVGVVQVSLVKRIVFLGGVTAFCTSSLWCFPHSLSYFNEFVGGPLQGDRHLLDSNVDWGQDLFYLQKWASDLPAEDQLTVIYYGMLNPKLASEAFQLPSASGHGQQGHSLDPGLYAVSTCMLNGLEFWGYHEDGSRSWGEHGTQTDLLNQEEVARVGYTFRVIRVAVKVRSD